MKRLLLILFSIISFNSFAQDVKFMGQNLGDDFDKFCNGLKVKGLAIKTDRFNKREFEGTFATYNDCRIVITSTEVSKKVKSAEVIFESIRNDEYEVNKTFKEILAQYQNKYGEAVKKTSTSDDYKYFGKTTYTIKLGDVVIRLNKFSPSYLRPDECSMSIFYYSESLIKTKEENTNTYSNDI